MDGILIVNKPDGWTSFDVIAKLRGVLRERSAGHTGTLDPMATGVLVVALGEATKLVEHLTAADKTYQASITFGAETLSLDAASEITRTAPVPESLREALAEPSRLANFDLLSAAIAQELARTEQVPPAVSAIHVNGQRAYDLARRGESVVLAPRPVQVRSLTVTGGTLTPAPTLFVTVTTTKGYYVRSLARDLAATLGTLGHLTALHRVRAGDFTLERSVAPTDPREWIEARVIPIAEAVKLAMPTCTLTEEGTRFALQGKALSAPHFASTAVGTVACFDLNGALVALVDVSPDGEGRVRRGFAHPSRYLPNIPHVPTEEP